MSYRDKVYSAFLLVILAAGCNATDDNTTGYYPPYIENETYLNGPASISISYNSYHASMPTIYHVASQGASTLNLSLNNLNNENVYFVFTNTSLSSSVSTPVVASSSVLSPSLAASKTLSGDSLAVAETTDETDSDEQEVAVSPDIPAVQEFNATADLGPRKSGAQLFEGSPEISMDSEGNSKSFFDDGGNSIAATCRKVVPNIHGMTLNIWVADADWGVSEGAGITQSVVDNLANAFLKEGTDNDIYEWITNLLGEPWGPHDYSNLIGDTNNITILLYDIDNNRSGGGVQGYYFSRDNYERSSSDKIIATSNERIMFYLDSYSCDADQDAIISTMAHEFQHLVHFYQKEVLLSDNMNSATWLNEMCSLMAEDLVAEKMEIAGPREIRLPLYVTDNYGSFVDWDTKTSIADYSTAYAFGAFLLRNYGGAELLSNIVHNSYHDYRAVAAAIYAAGARESFATAIRKWGAAALVSDSTAVPAGYLYNNNGSLINSSYGGIDYSLPSINMDNYGTMTTYSSLSGYGSLEESANLFYDAGDGGALSGDYDWTITLDRNMMVTVVVAP